MNATAPSNDFAGRVLGDKYLVGEKLGSGGYGTVYAAVQRDLQRPVAIKVLDGQVSDHDVARFEREARAAAALGHPHIVQVTDFSKRPGEPPFLVMEMLAGETLSSLMKRDGRVPPMRLAKIAQQILAALDVAHRAGIVHRDVKPANVFLVANVASGDFVKLLDFGIAKVGGDATALTHSGAMLGSPAYMAPEQVKGWNVDARTDVYALGATMYHALSGRYPFDAPTVHALLYAIAESRPPALASLDASIDPRMVGIVERAMQKDPALRFQSAAEMRAALDAFGDPSAARTVPHASYTAPVAPKSNAGLVIGILAAVVVLLLVTGGVGAYFYLRSATPEPVAAASTSSASAIVPSATAAPPPSTAPSPTATTKKIATPTASIAPTPSVPPAPKEVFGGTNPKFSAATYRMPGMKVSEIRPSIDAVLPSLKPCFVATEFDAPDHRSTWWTVNVDASGAVTNATRRDLKALHPKLDTCVTAALRTMKIPTSPNGGSFDVSFYAPAKGDF